MKHSLETRLRMSASHKGKKHSIETKEKMSKALIGNTRCLGIKFSKERSEQLSRLKKGRIVSPETLKRMSLSSPKVWLGKKFSEEHKKKIGLSNLGKKMSEESKKKMSESKTGEKNYGWYKDRTKLKKQDDRRSSAVHEWRKNVYNRDKFKCKFSNKDCDGRIEAHHILNWEDFPELRYELDNGITLCHAHHPHGRSKEEKLISTLKELLNNLKI